MCFKSFKEFNNVSAFKRMEIMRSTAVLTHLVFDKKKENRNVFAYIHINVCGWEGFENSHISHTTSHFFRCMRKYGLT